MNAKMIITVPVENIPQEVSKIMERLSGNAGSIKEKISNCTYNDNHTFIIEEIDSIRKTLSLIDNNLEDCYNILLGYVKYNTEQKIKAIENASVDSKTVSETNNG